MELTLTKKESLKSNLILVTKQKFSWQKEQDELDSLIETFKLGSREETTDDNNVNNSFGKNKKLDRLIIMEDVSGVADVSKNLLTFYQCPENLATIAFIFFM